MVPNSPRFLTDSIALALALTTLTVGCGSGVRLAKLDIQRTTSETRLADPAPSPATTNDSVASNTQAPPASTVALPTGNIVAPEPSAVANHLSPLGQVDMIDLIAGLSRQTRRSLDFAAAEVTADNEDRACGRLAQVVGAAEMAERLRVSIFPDAPTLSTPVTDGQNIPHWDELTHPLMAQAQTAYAQYCAVDSSNQHNDTYFGTLTARQSPNSLSNQIDFRAAAIAGDWNAYDIPLVALTRINDDRLVQQYAGIGAYLNTRIADATANIGNGRAAIFSTYSHSAAEICGASSKMLGSFDVWFDVMTDTRGGGTREQMVATIQNPAENTAFSRVQPDIRNRIARNFSDLVSVRDDSCEGDHDPRDSIQTLTRIQADLNTLSAAMEHSIDQQRP